MVLTAFEGKRIAPWEGSMGLREVLTRRSRRFVTLERLHKNLLCQKSANAATLEKLVELGVSSQDERRLEYFFYTNSAHKGSALAADLRRLGYEAEHRPAAASGRHTVVTGWTTPILMREPVVNGWTRHMCQLGFHYDCHFDGWGMTPDE